MVEDVTLTLSTNAAQSRDYKRDYKSHGTQTQVYDLNTICDYAITTTSSVSASHFHRQTCSHACISPTRLFVHVVQILLFSRSSITLLGRG